MPSIQPMQAGLIEVILEARNNTRIGTVNHIVETDKEEKKVQSIGESSQNNHEFSGFVVFISNVLQPSYMHDNIGLVREKCMYATHPTGGKKKQINLNIIPQHLIHSSIDTMQQQ